MIFATLGTNETPFDRLVTALAGLDTAGEELIVQRGASTVPLPDAVVHDFLPFEQLVGLMERARLVVTHAGVGSILVALSVGKRPIVVPRSRHYREAVDEHQSELADRLAGEGLVRVAPPDGLAAAIAAAGEAVVAARTQRSSALVDELRGIVDEAVHARPRRNG